MPHSDVVEGTIAREPGRTRGPKLVGLAIAVVLIVVAAVAVTVVRAHDDSARAAALVGTYPLPDDGWVPGDQSELVGVDGALHISRVGDQACAWIGSHETAFAWPSGWRARFNPTVLVDSSGKVVARDADKVSTGGGFGQAAAADTPCWKKGAVAFGVMPPFSAE